MSDFQSIHMVIHSYTKKPFKWQVEHLLIDALQKWDKVHSVKITCSSLAFMEYCFDYMYRKFLFRAGRDKEYLVIDPETIFLLQEKLPSLRKEHHLTHLLCSAFLQWKKEGNFLRGVCITYHSIEESCRAKKQLSEHFILQKITHWGRTLTFSAKDTQNIALLLEEDLY